METARQTSNQPTVEPQNDVAAAGRKNDGSPVAVAVGAAPAKPSRGRKPFIVLGIVAVVALIGVGTYSLLTGGRESTDDGQVAADVVPVSARVGGLVANVHIHENQAVKRGELLVELDPADFQARVQQAEADLANAQAQASAADAQVQIVDATSKGGLASARAALSGTAAGVGSADAQLASAKAAAARAAADLKKAEIDLGRSRTLRQAGAIPQERLESDQIALDSARAAKSQADAQVALAVDARRGAQSRVGEAQGRVNQSAPVAPQIAAARAGAALAVARVAGAQAALSLARLQLGYARITAPADGYASKLAVHDGQLVSMGQPLIELVPATTYLVANFKETQIGSMRPGQTATIEIDAFPGRKLTGRVDSLAGGTGASFSLLPPDNATGNFVKVVQRIPVRIAWVDPPADLVLRPGLSADVTVDLRSGK
ncbi:MAG TPA: HlyD family secretion protein [Polyangia bacterium]|jgi:membrane fusion protein (multidrug efflux system)|nr:HlyD family secretion protein [Polyangia bacterium]